MSEDLRNDPLLEGLDKEGAYALLPGLRLEEFAEPWELGKLYHARRTDGEGRCFVYVVDPSLVREPQTVLPRLVWHVQSLAGLSDTRCLSVEGFHTRGELQYAVCDHFESQTLEGMVLERGPLSWETAREDLITAAAAVSVVRDKGIEFVGVDPSLLRIGFGGSLRLVPFGGAAAGHPPSLEYAPYRPPEFWSESEEPGPAADVWALATSFCFAATGATPYAGAEVAEIRQQILSGELPLPLRDLAEPPPGSLLAVLRACLALDPAERPADTDRLRELLSPTGEVDLRETLDQFPEFGLGEGESDDIGPMTEELIPPALREFTVGSEESASASEPEPEPDPPSEPEPEPESEAQPAPPAAPPAAEPKATPTPPPPAQPKQESSSESVLDIDPGEIGLRPLDSTGRFLVNVPVTPIPELPPEQSREPSTPVSKRKRAPKTAEPTPRKRRLWPVVLLLLVIGLGAAGYQYRDKITELLDRGETVPEKPPVDPLIAKLETARSQAGAARERWNQGRDTDWPDPEQFSEAAEQMEKADTAERAGQRAEAIEALASATSLFDAALVAQEQSRDLARTAADEQRASALESHSAGESYPDAKALTLAEPWRAANAKRKEAEEHYEAGRYLDAEVAFLAAKDAYDTALAAAIAADNAAAGEVVERARRDWAALVLLITEQEPDLRAAYAAAGLTEERARSTQERVDRWATTVEEGDLDAAENDAKAASKEFEALKERCEQAAASLARIDEVERAAQAYEIPEDLRGPLVTDPTAAARDLLARAEYDGIEALLERVIAAPEALKAGAAARTARAEEVDSLKIAPGMLTQFEAWVAADVALASAEQALRTGDVDSASESFAEAATGFHAGAEAARELRRDSLARTRTLRIEGKPIEARRLVAGALNVFPEDASLRYEAAMCEGAISWAEGQHGSAAVAILAAIRLRPADPEANGLFLGALKDLCRQKEGDAAIEATALGLLRERAAIEPGYEPAATFASELAIRRANRERAANQPEPEPELDANTLVVSNSIAGAYRSVADAMEAAGPGMRILIRAGKYELEDALELRDGIRIVGEARDKVLLYGRGSGGTLLKADEVKDAKVSSVTFTGDGGGSRAQVVLEESTIQIEDCSFLKPGDECVVISKSGAPRFLRCTFADLDAEGVVVDGEGCNPLFKDCKVERRRRELNPAEREDAFDDKAALGFVFRDGANGQVVDSTCRGHRIGVFVENEDTRARLLRVTLVDCLVGVELRDASAEVSDCRITRCPDCGIRVAEDGATPVLRGNECTGSKIGIHFVDKASGRAESNTCRDALSAILVEDKAKPSLTGNTCTSSRYGIHYIEAAGTARDNVCEKNRDAGIFIDDDSSPAVQGNKCNGNLKDGIVVRGKSEPELIANTCESNQAAGIRFALKGYGKALRNTCTQNGTHGIVLGEDCEAVVRGNTCTVHPGFGILMEESDKDAVVEDNVCESNRTGIRCQNKARGTVRNNACRSNRDYGLHIADKCRIDYELGAGGNGIADLRDEND